MSDNLILAALARLEAVQALLQDDVGGIGAKLSSLREDIGVGMASLREDISVGMASLREDVGRIDTEMSSLREDVASLRADVSQLDAKQTSLRVDIMARMDRLQNNLTDIRNDISVNFGSADAVKRANDNTREELRALGDMVSALYRKINSLETRVRGITGDS